MGQWWRLLHERDCCDAVFAVSERWGVSAKIDGVGGCFTISQLSYGVFLYFEISARLGKRSRQSYNQHGIET